MYTNDWYTTLSAHSLDSNNQADVNNIRGYGYVSSEFVYGIGGVLLPYFYELCYFLLCRGWISYADDYNTLNYYLNIESLWWETISPSVYGSSSYIEVVYVTADGFTREYINRLPGGVLIPYFYELCYLIFRLDFRK